MGSFTVEKKSTGEEKVEYSEALENARRRMMALGNEIHEYLEHVQADVQNYKFTVEKGSEGLTVDVAFKAFVHQKVNEASKIIPK